MDFVNQKTIGVDRSTCCVDRISGAIHFWISVGDDIRPDDAAWSGELRLRLRGCDRTVLIVDIEATALLRPSARVDLVARLQPVLTDFPAAVVCVTSHPSNRKADMMQVAWCDKHAMNVPLPCDQGQEMTRSEVDFLDLALGGSPLP